MTEQIEFGSESENESENETKSEEEEARTLLHPMLKPQQTEHARKVELNQQRRKNGRGSTPNSQLKLETKTSWNLIPARIQPIIAPRTGAFHPIPSSEGTLGSEVPPIVQGSGDSHHLQPSDGMLGAAQGTQQPDAK